MKKTLSVIILLLCCIFIAKAQTQPNNEIWYTSSDGNVVKPNDSNFDGVSIVSNTYENGKGVITFNGELKIIGQKIFENKSTLTSITIPASVTEIGSWAFRDSGITALTIPASVKNIRYRAFFGCSNLSTLTFAEGSQLETIDDGAFNATNISGELTLPTSLKIIEVSAFNGCSGLTTLTFAKDSQLETIGASAFNGTGISGELTIPTSVTNIGNNAFGGCQLTKVYMSLENLSDISNQICIGSATIVVPLTLYEAYRSHFSGKNKVEVNPLKDWQEYTLGQIEAALQTVNTLSDTDKTTIATYISTTENATTFDEAATAYYAALALIDRQKALENKVKGALTSMGTKQNGPAVEIVGPDGQTFRLFNIKSVRYIKVKEK